eukprot:gene7632-7834_t
MSLFTSNSKQVLVASNNPAKLNAVKAAVGKCFPSLVLDVRGGVLLRDEDLHCFAWVAVKQQAAAKVSIARSAEFVLPQRISQLVLQQGLELGQADDQVFGRKQSGRGTGTVGVLTNNLVTRAHYYEHAVVMALIPYMNPSLYPEYVAEGPV